MSQQSSNFRNPEIKTAFSDIGKLADALGDTRYLAALFIVSQELGATPKPGDVMQIATDRITELSEFERAAIYLTEGEKVCLRATTPQLPLQFDNTMRYASVLDQPHIHDVIIRGKPVFIADTARLNLSSAEQAIVEHLKLRSILLLPLVVGQKVTGVLILATAQPSEFTESKINLYSTFANVTSLALENARLHELNQRYTQDLERRISVHKLAEEVLRESEERWKFALEGAGDGVWDSNLRTGETHYSKRWKEILGFEESDISNTREEWLHRIHTDDLPGVMADIQAHIDGLKGSTQAEFRMLCKDGNWKWVSGRGMVVSRDDEGNPFRIIGTLSDIAERKNQEAELRKTKERYELATTVGKVGIWDWDPVSGTVSWNEEMFRVMGLNPGEVMPSYDLFAAMVSQDDRKRVINAVREAIVEKKPYRLDFTVMRGDGAERICHASGIVEFDKKDRAARMLGTIQDITERQQIEEKVWQLAHFDSLTGLPNRVLLNDRVSQAISKAHRTQENFAVLFIDLDHFKNINDTLGHRIGDAVLMEVAKRLTSTVRDIDTVARLGGDEFILLLPACDAHGAEQLAKKLLHVIAQKYQVEHCELIVTSSVGIALYPKDGGDFDALSKCADIAMYRTKRDGRNGYRFFTSEI
jgi:diguanylate cyclase (GGDEF)-like protein/PAS domain S-box-containing protein